MTPTGVALKTLHSTAVAILNTLTREVSAT